MGKITKIEVQKNNKDRVNIFIDGVYSFAVSTETLLKNHLIVGSEISNDEFVNVNLCEQQVQCNNSAIALLSKMLKTKNELKNYLIKKEFPNNIVLNTISHLENFGLIDDRKYILSYINSHKTYGINKIKQELLLKGISKSLLDECLSSYEFNQNILQDLLNKYLHHKEKSFANQQKAMKYLISRGFTYNEVKNLDYGVHNESWD